MNERRYTVCKVCGRKLKSEQSQILGMGTVCYSKWQKQKRHKPLWERRGDNERENNAESPLQRLP